jgi:uncharacterized protein (TIGR02246 family)
MTVRYAPLAACLLVIAAAASCSQRAQPKNTTADVQAVNAAADHEIALLAAGNMDSLAAVFTADAVVMPPGEATFRGLDALRTWGQVFQQLSITAHYPAKDVTVLGDWAIQRYDYVETITPKAGGATTEEHGKGIHVFKRQPDGRWLIAQDIWNGDTPPAPVTPAPAPKRR